MYASARDFNTEFIKQIGLGANICRTYPKGHPSLLPIIQRLKVLIKEVPLEKEALSLVVVEDVIMIDEDRFDARRLPMVKSLVDRFNQLNIQSITFHVDLSDNDLREFFTALAATPAEIADYGDIIALMKARGIVGIKINKLKVGVISSDTEAREFNWASFLDNIGGSGGVVMSDEQRMQEMTTFLAGLGISGGEPANIQTDRIVGGLEKLALMIADQYGDERWDEYSLVFSRILSVLSPTIRKNIIKYKTENKKLAVLFKSLIPTMSDEDIVDMVSVKAKEKKANTEDEIVDILKNVTGTRLPDILSTLRMNVPELNFEKIVSRLMTEMKTTRGAKETDKFVARDLEVKLRAHFPKLRDPSQEERVKAIDQVMALAPAIFKVKNWDLMRLLVDRLDTMADAETNIQTFQRVASALADLYRQAVAEKVDDMIQFVSKKFGKHLMRKEQALIERKKIIIRTIAEIKDQNYVSEMISLLWEPGTFAEAREALIAFSEFSEPILIDTLRELDDRSIRMKILDILVRIGEKGLPEIRKMLDSPEWYVRRNGIWLMGEIKSAAAIDDLARLINDPEMRVQTEVIEALNKIGTAEARAYLRQALNSNYRQVIITAMKYCEPDDARRKIGEVLTWLRARKGVPDEKEERFRQSVIEVLAPIADDTALPVFNEILNERSLFKGDLLLPTKQAVLNAYIRMNTPNARLALQDAARHRDDNVAGMAQELIRRQESNKPQNEQPQA